MSENKTGKYFKYAIGEIILVVIGILIALQINNWNEERKNRIIEATLYESLIDNLESDLADVSNKIEVVNKALNAQNIFMQNSFDNLSNTYDVITIEGLLDDLANCSASFFPNYGYYNKIFNNNQIDLIQSKALQMKIIELYDQYYKRYNDLDLNIEHQNIFSLNNNVFSKFQNTWDNPDGQRLNLEILKREYAVLQDETQKISILTKLVYGSMTNCKIQIEDLLENLNGELNQ
jgi:Family of unknown function (DUF6090)